MRTALRHIMTLIIASASIVGLACAADWADKCAAWCFNQLEPDRYADQKYLDAWTGQFPGTVSLMHPGINAAPHGFHVAYGLLVLLAVEGRDESIIADLEVFYRAIGLPLSLTAMGLTKLSLPVLKEIAALTTAAPDGAYLVVSASAEQIVEGIRQVEDRASRSAAHTC